MEGTRVRGAIDGRWDFDPLGRRLVTQLPLLRVWTRREFSVRYRQSLLGFLWSVVQPAATLLIFGGILSGVLGVGSEGFPYVSFAYAGLVLWSFTASALSAAVPSLLGAGQIVSKVYFPRELVPLAAVGACCFDLVVNSALLAVVLMVQGIGIDRHLPAILAIEAVLVLWVAAVSVIGAMITVFLRDLRHALPLIIQLGFIATPVMYPSSLLTGKLEVLTRVNPVAVVIEAMRDVTLRQTWPNWTILGVHAAVAMCLLLAAVAYTRSVEPRIVDLL